MPQDVFDTLTEPTGRDIFDLVGSDSPAPMTEQAVKETSFLKAPSPAFIQPLETAVRHNIEPILQHPLKAAYEMFVPTKENTYEPLKQMFTDPGKAFSRDTPIGSQKWWDEFVGFTAPILFGAVGKAFKGPKLGQSTPDSPSPATSSRPESLPFREDTSFQQDATTTEPTQTQSAPEATASRPQAQQYESLGPQPEAMPVSSEAQGPTEPSVSPNQILEQQKRGELNYDEQQRQTQSNNNGVQAEEIKQSDAPSDLPDGTGERVDNLHGTQEQRQVRGAEVTDRKLIIESLVRRMNDEAKGREVLIDAENGGKTPSGIIQEFWDNTYHNLPKSVQLRFQRYIRNETDLTHTEIEQEGGYSQLYTPDIGGSKFENLEGTQRGLIALMEAANRNFGGVVESLPSREGALSSGSSAPPSKLLIEGQAGSTPAEPPRVTSIKNEVVDSERSQRGLEPAMATAGRDFGDVWNAAMSEIEKNPGRPLDLVNELKEKARSLNDTEDALLLHRQIDLQNQFEKTANDLSIANEGGNQGMVDELNLRAAKLSDDLLDVYNAGKGAGTETGRGLNARKMLAAEDYSLASMITKKRAANKGGQLTPEQVAEVGKTHEQIKAAQLSVDEYEAKRLAAFKKRTVKRTGELEAKTAAGDFTTKQRTPIQLDAEGLRLRGNLERAKLDFQKGLTKDRISNRPTWEKAFDGIAKWRRTFVLTWPTVLAKLTSASGELIGITPLEEIARSGVTKVLPKKLTAKAERYGAGLNIRTEVGAITHTFRTLFKAAGQKFKTGHSDIDLLYGKPDALPHEFKDYVSNLHGALKEPARQNEFFRSFEKRLQNEASKGVDVTDPLVQTKIGFRAYKDANAQIFMEQNMVADAIQRGLHRFGEINKQTGKASVIGKTAQTGVKFELPIVKIPLNIVKRSFEYSFGTATGSFRLARALVNGLDKLKPEEADIIVRNLSRGSLGMAFVAYGYFNPEQIGGYYQMGEKRGTDDVKAGGIQIAGLNIPRVLVHNPLLEQLQIGSTIRRVADSKLRKKDSDPQGTAAGVMAGYTGLIEEVPFIQQAERSLKALNPHERKQFLGELSRSVVPGVVEWAARMLDKEDGEIVPRKPQEVLDYPKAAIPFLRQDVPRRTETTSRNYSRAHR